MDENNITNLFYDFDFKGSVDEKGEISQVWGEQALNNALRMWLASQRGECIRDVRKGGYVYPYFSGLMNEDKASLIEIAIRDGLQTDFSPPLEILNLEIIPVTSSPTGMKYWEINLAVRSTELKISTSISEKIKARV